MNNPQIIVKNAPFKRFCMSIGAIPTSYLDSLDYYETLLWLIKYLEETIIPTVNNNGEAVSELQTLYIQLKDFVENYFANLDVQEEINNKLDDMVEDGTLQTIIGDFLNANALWCFDTVEDMKNATNLINGSYAKTLGYYSANDGGNGTYKISNSEDIEDLGSIINLTSGLQAHLIPTNNEINIKQFGSTENTDSTNFIQNAINYAQDKKITLKINSGTYLISNVIISKTITILGENRDLSIIKSIDNNNNEAIISLYNDGLINTKLSDFTINGNKNNNANIIHGIMLHCNDVNSDKFTLIKNITIHRCSGNGLYTKRTLTSNDIREIRIFNCRSFYNDKSGFLLDSCTDSFFDKNTSSGNFETGFTFKGGNNKINNCKAFWNGEGDNTTLENINRLPNNAFTETTDTEYVSGKTYYTRSGDNTQHNWYQFVLFTGNAFEEDTTYYEMTKEYFKKYSGFSIESSRNLITGCESQDNHGDGFYIYGSENTLTGVLCDNNGLLATSGVPYSYASVNKEQLYYGIYATSLTMLNVIGTFTNFRYNSIGITQKAPIYIRNSSFLTFRINASNQLNNFVMIQGGNMDNFIGVCNNENLLYNYDYSNIVPLVNGLKFYEDNPSQNSCYIKKFNNVVYMRLILFNELTNKVVSSDTGNVELFRLPAGFRPKTLLNIMAPITYNNGYNSSSYAYINIDKEGHLRLRTADENIGTNQIVIETTYTTL